MGSEAVCRVTWGSQPASEAKVLLETEELIVRGTMKLRIPFREMERVAADGDALLFHWKGAAGRVEVGSPAATKWAEKIRHPKPVIDKLGVKAGQRVTILGDVGAELDDAIRLRSGDVSTRMRKESDVVFFAATEREQLPRLTQLRASLASEGAIWVIRPKATPAIADADVIGAARAAGLVDVKVVKVSEALTGEKLVIPVTKR